MHNRTQAAGRCKTSMHMHTLTPPLLRPASSTHQLHSSVNNQPGQIMPLSDFAKSNTASNVHSLYNVETGKTLASLTPPHQHINDNCSHLSKFSRHHPKAHFGSQIMNVDTDVGMIRTASTSMLYGSVKRSNQRYPVHANQCSVNTRQVSHVPALGTAIYSHRHSPDTSMYGNVQNTSNVMYRHDCAAKHAVVPASSMCTNHAIHTCNDQRSANVIYSSGPSSLPTNLIYDCHKPQTPPSASRQPQARPCSMNIRYRQPYIQYSKDPSHFHQAHVADSSVCSGVHAGVHHPPRMIQQAEYAHHGQMIYSHAPAMTSEPVAYGRGGMNNGAEVEYMANTHRSLYKHRTCSVSDITLAKYTFE